MRPRRRCRCITLFVALALLAGSATAEAAPPVRLHVADDSTSCEGARGLGARLAERGIVLSSSDASGAEIVDVNVRTTSTASGARAELVLRAGNRTASRSLEAPSCAEVMDALVFALGLALEQPIEDTAPAQALPAQAPPAAPSPSPPAAPAEVPRPEAPSPSAPSEGPPFAWGGGAGVGVVSGALPSASTILAIHADLESRARGLFAPSVALGGALVLPSTTSSSGKEIAFALQMGMVDACPLRVARGRFDLRPCVELQVGRLQGRSSGFVGARLESSPWVALALALRGRVEIGAGVYFEVDFAAGSPLIQDVFSVGNDRVFAAGPGLFSGTAGGGVHFP